MPQQFLSTFLGPTPPKVLAFVPDFSVGRQQWLRAFFFVFRGECGLILYSTQGFVGGRTCLF